MGRPSKPHFNSESKKWRFRWSIEASTRAEAVEAAKALRGLAGWKPIPEQVDKGYRVTWAVVRADERDIWREFARYKGGAEVADEPLTVAELIQHWETDNSATDWESYVVDKLDAFAGAEPLVGITADFLARFSKRLKADREFGQESRRKFLRYASAVMRYGADRGWLARAPTPAKAPQPEPVPKAIAKDQLVKLFTDLRGQYTKHLRIIVRFAIETGMRLGEICRLQWHQVDPDSQTIRIEAPGHKTGERTGAVRIIYLSRCALRILGRRRGRDPKYVFISWKLGKPYTPSGLSSTLRHNDVTPLALRHTFAQRAIDRGIAPHVVSKMLGHKDSKMVWVYARIKDEQVHRAVAQLEERALPRRGSKARP